MCSHCSVSRKCCYFLLCLLIQPRRLWGVFLCIVLCGCVVAVSTIHEVMKVAVMRQKLHSLTGPAAAAAAANDEPVTGITFAFLASFDIDSSPPAFIVRRWPVLTTFHLISTSHRCIGEHWAEGDTGHIAWRKIVLFENLSFQKYKNKKLGAGNFSYVGNLQLFAHCKYLSLNFLTHDAAEGKYFLHFGPLESEQFLTKAETRSPAIARKSRSYHLRPMPSVQIPVTERKQFVRWDSSMHAMLTEHCLESYIERLYNRHRTWSFHK